MTIYLRLGGPLILITTKAPGPRNHLPVTVKGVLPETYASTLSVTASYIDVEGFGNIGLCAIIKFKGRKSVVNATVSGPFVRLLIGLVLRRV